jgi:PadR family transcriptional regulator PadR
MPRATRDARRAGTSTSPKRSLVAIAGSTIYLPLSLKGERMLDPEGLLRGTLDVLILKSVSWGPRHGYAIAEWIHTITDQELLVEEGPLYTALHRLERKGWLTAEWGYSEKNRKAKYYQLSRSGRAQLRSEASSWDRYVRAIAKALAATSPATA